MTYTITEAAALLKGHVMGESILYRDETSRFLCTAQGEDLDDLLWRLNEPRNPERAIREWYDSTHREHYGPRVWVSNQPEHQGFDNTSAYLSEAGIIHIEDDRGPGCILPVDYTWEAEKRFKAAAAAVAAVGHGDADLDEEEEPLLEWVNEPSESA